MAVGFIDKDFIEEGPNRLVYYDIQMDDPSILENVNLWVGQKGRNVYYMGAGVEKVIDGETVYVFNIDTRSARQLMSDGSLETKEVQRDTDEDGELETVIEPKYTVLKTGVRYTVEVTYTSSVLTEVRAKGGEAAMLLRESISIQ